MNTERPMPSTLTTYSPVTTRISAMAAEMRRPVTTNGRQLGSTTRHTRWPGLRPNDRAVSLPTGSTSLTACIDLNSSGKTLPITARVILSSAVVPKMSTSNGINATDGTGRRKSMVTRVSR